MGDETDKASNRRQAVQCRFCGHYYIRPCTASTQAECLNVKLATPLSEPQASIRHHYIPVFYLKRGWRPNLRQLATERANSVRFLRPVEVVSQNTTLPVSFSTNDRFAHRVQSR
jgi:hypothetical protein